MSVSETMETEEDLTCLHISFYHPQQHVSHIYNQLPLGTRTRHHADSPLRLGRDSQECTYSLLNPRVSRKQLSLTAYRTPQGPAMLFSIQNLSQRGRLSVDGSALGYLERMDLPDKALVRFGDFEMLIIRESGEAKDSFEVDFRVLRAPPSRETPPSVPVMDTGMMNGFTGDMGPQESDESLS